MELVNPLEPPGVLSVSDGLPLELPGVMRVSEGEPIGCFELSGVLGRGVG